MGLGVTAFLSTHLPVVPMVEMPASMSCCQTHPKHANTLPPGDNCSLTLCRKWSAPEDSPLLSRLFTPWPPDFSETLSSRNHGFYFSLNIPLVQGQNSKSVSWKSLQFRMRNCVPTASCLWWTIQLSSVWVDKGNSAAEKRWASGDQ